MNSDLSWRKSSFSGSSGGNCVEVANHDRHVLVRDTKTLARGPVHRYTPTEWQTFLRHIRNTL